MAFLTHFSVMFALQTDGQKLAKEPKSDKNITDFVFAEQYTRRTYFLVWQRANSFYALLTKNWLFWSMQTDKTKF